MSKYILVEKHNKKRVISSESESIILQVKEMTENYRDGVTPTDYLVTTSFASQSFEFDSKTGKFYLYTSNDEKMEEQNEKHSKLIDGKTIEEQKEILEGLYVDYIDQREYILIHNGKNLSDKVLDLIK